MNKQSLILLMGIGLFLTVVPMTKPGHTDSTKSKIRHMVQMPIAVKKASELGIPNHDLTKVAKALNDAKANPSSFNLVFRLMPRMALELKNFRAIGNFLDSQIEQGIKGSKLANTVITELQKFGIDRTVSSSETLFPASQSFYTGDLRKSLEEVKKEIAKKDHGRDEPPEGELETKPQSGPGRAPPGRPRGPGGQFPLEQ